MCRRILGLRWMWIVLAAGVLLGIGTSQAIAQTEETPTDNTEITDSLSTDATNPPGYITELLDASELTQEQVDVMRADGMGWGEIRIAVRLAEEIAAASDGALTFDQALIEVQDALDAGLGFGEIAKEHNLNVGQLVGSRDQKLGDAAEDGLEAHQGNELGETKRVTARKRGLFARIGKFLGFGKKERTNQASETTEVAASGKAEKVQKVEKVEKMERPSKPEKPEKPTKPEKPEKPERGPNR